MRRISFDQKLPLIVIKALVKKRDERILRLAHDTGSSRTIIPFEVTQAIGCDPAGSSQRTRIVTGSGVEIAPLVTLGSIKALGVTIRNLEVACHDLSEESFVAGLLGLDFLKNFRLVIDFGKGEIEIS